MSDQKDTDGQEWATEMFGRYLEDRGDIMEEKKSESPYSLDAFTAAFPEETRSMRLDYQDVVSYEPGLADGLSKNPDAFRGYAKNAIERATSAELEEKVTIRVQNLPETDHYRVGKYRRGHLSTLITVEGKVIEASNVQPHAEVACYVCLQCGAAHELQQRFGNMVEPTKCGNEECQQAGPFRFDPGRSDLSDWQKVVLIPTDTTADDPQLLDVHLREDICGRLDKGHHVTVTGVYRTYPTQNETVLDTYLDAWDLDGVSSVEVDALSAEDLAREIRGAVDKQEEEFGADRDAVVDSVAELGVQRDEVEDRIDDMLEDRELMSVGDDIALP